MKRITKYIYDQVAANQLPLHDAKAMLMELQGLAANPGNETAIIGMAGKFPKAANLDEYWCNLVNGVNCIGPFPEPRTGDYREQCAKSALARLLSGFFPGDESSGDGDIHVHGGYLNEIDKFDAAFFRISPREAVFMDPWQRIFLETAYEAMEDAGYGGKKISSAKVGVFVGRDHTVPSMYRYLTEPHPMHFTGSWTGIVASRIAHIYNFRGPSMVIDTACSSGLAALHEARRALYHNECDMAIAGGIHLQFFPMKRDSGFIMAMLESPDQCVRAFAKDANGTVWGEGAGAVILKPLHKAVADGDHVHAVIKSSALNNNGTSSGITAPNADAQKEVILRAWKEAQIDPETISYIEAHGTGTSLGDPIEIEGITSAFNEFTDKKQFCGIGSVKTNVGHLAAASGLASLIKVVLALQHNQIPASINFNTPNPYINFGDSPVYVNDQNRPWEPGGDYPRRAGISAFGFSGTNCHIVLEEAPVAPTKPLANQDHPLILTVSARNKMSLDELLKRYRKFLAQTTDSDLAHICYTANTGRGHYDYRMAFRIDTLKDLQEKLAKLESHNWKELQGPGLYFGIPEFGPDHRAVREAERITGMEKGQLNALAHRKLKEYWAGSSGVNGSRELGETLCQLYIQGADIDWDELYQNQNVRRVSIPVYPLERIKYWAEPDNTPAEEANPARNLVPLDRDGLPEPGWRMNTGVEYVAPRDDIENRLKILWQEIFGIERIGVHDNFFDLGGHSLMIHQLIEKAKPFNLKIAAADVFTANTIAQMAAIIRQNNQTESMDQVVEGEVPLIPVQSCFFERRFPEPHHWNVSMMFYGREGFDAAALNQVLTEIVAHHEALRMVFRNMDGRITQYNRSLDGALFDLKVLDFTDISDSTKQIAIEAEKIQESLDLQNGPLMKVGLFKTRHGDHLLITIHHLVIDGESFRILLEDLQTGYFQVLNGTKIQFKHKTSSFVEWAVQLQRYGRDQTILQELDYWRTIEETPIRPLPKDKIVRDRCFKFSKIILATLPEDQTAGLLQKMPYRLSIQEALLTAFGLALKDWTGENKALIRVIGNGRNMALGGVNLSRTIGWLSISYPVILDMSRSGHLAEQIRFTRDTLRSIPGNGAGYDILRYITLPLNPDLPKFKAMPEIIFNFLGVMEDNHVHPPGLIEESTIPQGLIKSPQSPKEYTIDFTAAVLSGKLRISLDYHQLEYQESTMHHLIELYLRNLKRILTIDQG
jgi:non-ribosomal peptide synthase protein (TIGR01720 family)